MRAFEGMDLYGVSLNLPSSDGGMTLVSADTVRVDFRLGEVLDVVPGVRRLEGEEPSRFIPEPEPTPPGRIRTGIANSRAWPSSI